MKVCKMNLKYLLFSLLLVNVNMICGEEYDVNGFCTLVPDGTKLASIESCQKYYICEKGKATEMKCLSNDLAFDKNAQTCKSLSLVKCASSIVVDEKKSCVGISEGYLSVPNSCSGYIYCKDGVEIGQGNCPNGLTFNNGVCDYSQCSNVVDEKKSCVGISEGYLSVPNSCSGYIYCKDGVEIGQGNCPNGLTFNNGVCDYSKCTTDVNKTTQLTSSCDVIPNNIFFGSTMSCNTYLMCTNDKFNANECPNNLVLDIQKQMCNYGSTGNFCSHVTEEELLPSSETIYPSCSNDGEKTSISKDCTAYYICTDSKKQKKNCSANQYFDHDDQICKARQEAKPNKDCDRCLGSQNAFVNAIDETCQNYLGCSNGKTLYTGTCVDETFFNEDLQACVPLNMKPNYAATHGACRKSPESSTSNNIPTPPTAPK